MVDSLVSNNSAAIVRIHQIIAIDNFWSTREALRR
jgi:hypothetical protein